MRIDVTQEDIEKGEPFGCYSCPIARALQRTVGGGWAVKSDMLRQWTSANVSIDIALPRDAKAFIDDFDHDRPVQPFSFDLDLPTE